MRTSDDWLQLYKIKGKTGKYDDFYREARQEVMDIGYQYMTGQVSINELATWLTTVGTYWPFKLSESHSLIRKGVKLAIEDGISSTTRVQPLQDETFFSELARLKEVRKSAGKKVARHGSTANV